MTSARNGAVAGVTVPEPILGGPLRSLVPNRAALYLRWLLLFEPRVVLTSVPYRPA